MKPANSNCDCMTELPMDGTKRSHAQVCLSVCSPVLPSAFQQVKPPTGAADASVGTLQRCLLYQQLAVEWNIGKHTAGLLCLLFFVFFHLPGLPTIFLSSALCAFLEVKLIVLNSLSPSASEKASPCLRCGSDEAR